MGEEELHLDKLAVYILGAAIVGDAELEINLKSSNAADDAPERAGELRTICCSGVRESRFVLPSKEPALISISSEEPLLWDYRAWKSIFGNAPLPDPPRFLFEYQRLLRDHFKLDRDPLCYLNFRDRIAEWREFVYQRSFHLLTAPTLVQTVFITS